MNPKHHSIKSFGSCLKPLIFTFRRHLNTKAERRVRNSVDHFEDFYSQIYGSQWLSIYSSLQHGTGYCAVINKYCDKSASLDFLRGLDFTREVDLLVSRKNETKHNLQCFITKNGELFPKPKPGPNGVLGYYMMDMASLVPILNLDIQPEDSVLDMCASPGGKTIAILQHLSGRGVVVANDALHSRRTRLKKVLKSYIPRRYQHFVYIKSLDGIRYGDYEPNTYEKVLVDVPCSADRHGVHDEFHSSTWSVKKSQKNSETQKKLLISALKTVCPNGIVVYSTCTLSPLENEDVVKYALQYCSENNINIQLEPCLDVRRYFSTCKNTKIGTLIIPSVESNWGPMYICKFIKNG